MRFARWSFVVLSIAVLGAAALFASQKTHSVSISDITGNRLLEICSGPDSNDNFCFGFIAGVRDAGALMSAMQGQKPVFVTPTAVTQEQMRDVVLKYLNEHPEERHKAAAMLIFFAFTKAFPPTQN